jgi:predicted RND superfamily exporter protein
VAVRHFGIAAAIGVMADMVVSFDLVPLMLRHFPIRSALAPSGDKMGRRLSDISRALAPRSRTVLLAAALLAALSVAGIFRLRASTNHIAFFPKSSPIRQSAGLIDDKLAGVYSFEIVLAGEPDTFKDPDLLRRIDHVVHRIKQYPDIPHAVSFLDGLKKIHRALAGTEAEAEGSDLPGSVEGVAQSVFLYGLSDAGRFDLRSYLTSDFSRMRIWVKMRSRDSEELFAQIQDVEEMVEEELAADRAFGLDTFVTGVGRLFFALDVYLMESQLQSFATAFITVFGVIFIVLRSWRYGLLSIIPNLIPIAVILGIMGWLGITLNVATVMVASVALGVIDDDTVHFIMRFRREIRLGADPDRAIDIAIETAGGAALLAALINALAFGIMATCPNKPIAYWGWLMSVTMFVAFLSEIILLPAVLRVAGPFLAKADGRNST